MIQENSSKRVLMINYAFPPVAGSGVIRILKFVKYLPENGWRPLILTTNGQRNGKIDYSMTKEIPEQALVYRTKAFYPLNSLQSLRSSGDTKSVKTTNNRNGTNAAGIAKNLKKA